MASVKYEASVVKHPGPPASTSYIVPFTSEHDNNRAAPVIGLVPTSPVIAEVGTSVIPLSERRAKFAATPRFTVS